VCACECAAAAFLPWALTTAGTGLRHLRACECDPRPLFDSALATPEVDEEDELTAADELMEAQSATRFSWAPKVRLDLT
jgi:hypothetical protein